MCLQGSGTVCWTDFTSSVCGDCGPINCHIYLHIYISIMMMRNYGKLVLKCLESITPMSGLLCLSALSAYLESGGQAWQIWVNAVQLWDRTLLLRLLPFLSFASLFHTCQQPSNLSMAITKLHFFSSSKAVSCEKVPICSRVSTAADFLLSLARTFTLRSTIYYN